MKSSKEKKIINKKEIIKKFGKNFITSYFNNYLTRY